MKTRAHDPDEWTGEYRTQKPAAVEVVTVRLTVAEHEACAHMQRMGGWPTIEELIKASLWRMGRHLELDLPLGLFAPAPLPPRRRRGV